MNAASGPPHTGHPPARRLRAERPPTGRSVLAFLAVWVGGAAVLATAGWFAAGAALHGAPSQTPTLLAVALAYASIPAAALVVYRTTGVREQLAVRAPGRRALGPALGAWVAVLAAAVVVQLGVGASTGSLFEPSLAVVRSATDMARFAHSTTVDWVLIVVRALLLAAIGEELVFRGLLYGWLARYLPMRGVVVVTSVLFTAEHGYYPVLLPMAMLFGLATGWLRSWSGSVVPGMAVHVLTDALLFVIALTATAHGVPA